MVELWKVVCERKKGIDDFFGELVKILHDAE